MTENCAGSHAPLWNWVVFLFIFAVLVVGSPPAAGATTDHCGEMLAASSDSTELVSEVRVRRLGALLDKVSGRLGECAGEAAKPLPGEPDVIDPDDLGRGDHATRWRTLAAFFFPRQDLETVICLIGRESRGDASARNQVSGAGGLMQVMPSWAPVYGYGYQDLFRPEVNLWVARQIRDEHGWESWSPYRRGACH